jgi:hypothetical protein
MSRAAFARGKRRLFVEDNTPLRTSPDTSGSAWPCIAYEIL